MLDDYSQEDEYACDSNLPRFITKPGSHRPVNSKPPLNPYVENVEDDDDVAYDTFDEKSAAQSVRQPVPSKSVVKGVKKTPWEEELESIIVILYAILTTVSGDALLLKDYVV